MSLLQFSSVEYLHSLTTIFHSLLLPLEVDLGAPKYYKPFLIDRNNLIPPKIERYELMPPMRLLSLAVLLCCWLGWVLTEKGFDVYGELKINEAFEFVRILSTTDIIP